MTAHSWRSLRRSPVFSLAAVLSLGVGIGLNAAVFSAVHGVLLRPLGLPQPERLVAVRQDMRALGGKRDAYAGWAVFASWRAGSRSFVSLAAHGNCTADLSSLDPAESVPCAVVSHEFFSTIGVQPFLGRGFLAQEEVKGRHGVVVLSHQLWVRRFGSDPSVVGRAITVTGMQRTIVGVLPPGFVWPFKPGVEIWLLQWLDPLPQDWGVPYVGVVGRLAPGVSAAAAQADMDRVAAALAADHPAKLHGVGATLVPLRDAVVGPAGKPLWLLLGAAGLVLLLACLNVANLGVARAAAREGELAVRLALGAGRARFASLFVGEGLLLGAGGAVTGLALGAACLTALRGLAPPQTPRLGEIRLDGAVVVWTVTASLVVGLAAGCLPALWVSRQRLFAALRGTRGGAQGRGGLRARGALIAAEIAASVVLLGGAALLLRSLAALGRVDPGFRTERMVFGVVFVVPRHPPDRRDVAEFVAELEERLRARPEIAAVGTISDQPLAQATSSLGFGLLGQTLADEQRQTVTWRTASPGYFEAFRIPLVAGRFFERGDRMGSPPVALVNEELARRYLGGPAAALGRRVHGHDAEGPDAPWRQIVGVVGNFRGRALDHAPEPEIYLSMIQAPMVEMTVVARAAGPAGAALAAIQETARSLRPGQVLGERQTMQEALDRGLAPRRFAAGLTATFAGVALLLAAVGIYGVVAFAVAQRRQELAVRQALGATPRSLAALVLGWCGALVAAGAAVGLGGWLALGKVVASLLYEVRPLDGVSVGVAVGFLVVVALAAAGRPAWLAGRIDAARVLSDGL